jgi:hypothetical protein
MLLIKKCRKRFNEMKYSQNRGTNRGKIGFGTSLNEISG